MYNLYIILMRHLYGQMILYLGSTVMLALLQQKACFDQILYKSFLDKSMGKSY